MAPRTYLTTDLRHLPKPRPLKPGEALLVRYKNSLRQYKADVWIGIVLPDKFGPSRHINRRPVGAQPAEGPWKTHPKDRVYSIYLPGRNMYKWIGLQDIFVLNEKTPNVLRRAQREPDSKIWDDIMEIVRTEPGLEFWKNMSLQELGAKGKRGKGLRLVLPSGHEDLVSGEESDDEKSESEPEKEDKDEEDEHQEVPYDHVEPVTDVAPNPSNEQATIRSFSDSRAAVPTQGVQLRQTLGLSQDANPVVPASEPIPFADRESSCLRTTRQFHPCPPLVPPTTSLQTPSQFITPPTAMTQSTVPKVENDISPNIADVVSQPPAPEFSIFDLTISQALKHVFLNQCEAARIVDVFLGAAALEKQPEYLHIREYLADGEFNPRLITLKNSGFSHPTPFPTVDPDNKSTQFRLVGDQMGLGQNFKLHGVNNSLDLETAIISLGRVYLQARRFGLIDLVYRVTFKLQVAWNCYPELYQSKPILGVASLAFAGRTDFDEDGCDYLQAWLIHFIAEASDLLIYSANDQFWGLLRAHPKLQDKVLNLRTVAHINNPELYGNTIILLESRGLGNL
ncbi:uncharacterized protein N7479_008715 [Penicillium vulpinum]|uniref:Uncharacterized protein n=1 Tax=Penicillium vulpinum TaxID=29845 RepID=A0A1V6S1T3_9EURO|nr:uncharacterized protein N7479_008715 [Penicillium vulpinum]KAJ5950302.1 hypothetical protein N7479_008715 [Penicillium vulpinum]OQE07680.1 hypothetical protein PENVUL_c012G06030 [Penicillium vulpinum]